MSQPRVIVEALTRRGRPRVVIEHLLAHGPSSAEQIGRAHQIERTTVRSLLVMLRATGLAELADPGYIECARDRSTRGRPAHRYYLNPDALHYAARWLDALADRAERANRAAAIAPVPAGRAR